MRDPGLDHRVPVFGVAQNFRTPLNFEEVTEFEKHVLRVLDEVFVPERELRSLEPVPPVEDPTKPLRRRLGLGVAPRRPLLLRGEDIARVADDQDELRVCPRIEIPLRVLDLAHDLHPPPGLALVRASGLSEGVDQLRTLPELSPGPSEIDQALDLLRQRLRVDPGPLAPNHERLLKPEEDVVPEIRPAVEVQLREAHDLRV